ncbi:CO dehydrogenase iron-sulfur protein CooF [Methanosarcina sp. MTP4]|uniref:4Fe-4S dicluster domain-containing protein n=1 Tax=Methanosarcina sp. MTP4 TaxID=1434100 RepID=UPI0006157B0B|nr:4Fe-4S dicluster domain-containing protein [Methanosarcina sp. MTP4]AKB24647.1 CO dehydrogenase iron-sulfur protein CooF [Methanosarcina sp. MTP4]
MKEVMIRPERCMGCRSCEIACAVEHSESKDLFTAIGESPVPRKRIYVEYIPDFAVAVPITCRHCEDAPCTTVCPTNALSRDEVSRRVTHNPDLCIGCWTCSMVCNYGVIGRQKEARVAVKCDLCPDREVPACVEACPTGALVFAEVKDFSGIKRSQAALKLAKGVQTGIVP